MKDLPNYRRTKLQTPDGQILELKNAQLIPAFYLIPKSFLMKCGREMMTIPRDFNKLLLSASALRKVQSDLFLLTVVDCYAYMVWPFLCSDIPYMEIFSGNSPTWKIAHSAPVWINELYESGFMPTFRSLFSRPKDNLVFEFYPEEIVSFYMSIIVPSAVKKHDLQIILDTEKEMRCIEDFDERSSRQKIDFYRKWYHTRSKKAEFSLEGYQEQMQEQYDDMEWEVPDPISSFEDEVVEIVDVQKFLSKLSEKDKQILQMREEGYTHQEIADKLGYKTHSAVVKRIKKIGEKYQEHSGLNFGF